MGAPRPSSATAGRRVPSRTRVSIGPWPGRDQSRPLRPARRRAQRRPGPQDRLVAGPDGQGRGRGGATRCRPAPSVTGRSRRSGSAACRCPSRAAPTASARCAHIHAALDAGVTFIDTADAYHVHADEVGHNEALDRRGAADLGRRRRRRPRRDQGRAPAPRRRLLDAGRPPRAPPRRRRRSPRGGSASRPSACTSSTVPTRPSPTPSPSGRSPSCSTPARSAMAGISNADPRPDPGGARRARRPAGQRAEPVLARVPDLSRPSSTSAPSWASRSCRGARSAASRRRPASGRRTRAFGEVAEARGVSPQQVALAWMLATLAGRRPDPGCQPTGVDPRLARGGRPDAHRRRARPPRRRLTRSDRGGRATGRVGRSAPVLGWHRGPLCQPGWHGGAPCQHAAALVPAQLVQAVVVDAEVVCDLVDDGDRHLVDDLLPALAVPQRRTAVHEDPIRQRPGRPPAVALGERRALVQAEQVGVVVAGPRPRRARRRCPSARSARGAPRRAPRPRRRRSRRRSCPPRRHRPPGRQRGARRRADGGVRSIRSTARSTSPCVAGCPRSTPSPSRRSARSTVTPSANRSTTRGST